MKLNSIILSYCIHFWGSNMGWWLTIFNTTLWLIVSSCLTNLILIVSGIFFTFTQHYVAPCCGHFFFFLTFIFIYSLYVYGKVQAV